MTEAEQCYIQTQPFDAIETLEKLLEKDVLNAGERVALKHAIIAYRKATGRVEQPINPKQEKKKRPCEDCENSEWYFHGWRCKRFGQQIKMDRQTCIADEREEERRDFVDFSRYVKTAIFDPSKPTIEERLAKIEERLTEIDGVLTSIGSPKWDLRKKVEELEAKPDKKDIEENNEALKAGECDLPYVARADYFWKKANDNNGKSQAKCPKNCGWEIYEYKASKPINFCPNCGTKVED